MVTTPYSRTPGTSRCSPPTPPICGSASGARRQPFPPFVTSCQCHSRAFMQTRFVVQERRLLDDWEDHCDIWERREGLAHCWPRCGHLCYKACVDATTLQRGQCLVCTHEQEDPLDPQERARVYSSLPDLPGQVAGGLLSYGGPELFPGTRACSSGSTPVDCPSTLTYRGLSSCTGEGFRGGQGSRRRTRVAKEDSVSDLGPPAQLWPRKRPQQAGGDLPKYTSLAVRRRSRADWAAVAAHVCRGARRCSATRGSALPWTAGLTAEI